MVTPLRGGRKPASVPTFTPTYVHRAFGMNMIWARALETMRRPDGRRIPGSARRVLEILLGAHARKKGPVSQLGIVRLSGDAIPRATVQHGLQALAEVGIVESGKNGWALTIHRPLKGSSPAQIGHQLKGEVPSPLKPHECHGASATKEETPSSTSAWAAALLNAGFRQGGAWKTAKQIRAPFTPRAVEAALKLAERRKARNPEGLASWFLIDEWSKVKAQIRKDMARGNAVDTELLPGPLRCSPGISQSLVAWRRLQSFTPSPAGLLDHEDELRRARGRVVELVERTLGSALDDDRTRLRDSMATSGIKEASLTWKVLWTNRWSAQVLKSAGIQLN